MKKALVNLIVIIYIIVAIAVTICLLSYNEYKVSEFGDKTLVIMDETNKDLPEFQKNDLIIVGKENYKAANEGEKVFFYQDRGIKIAEIEQKQDFGEAGVIFTVQGNYQVVNEDVIGTSNNMKVISKVGGVLRVLESKWGFLFLIVFPSLLAFLYEVYQLIKELTNKNDKG